MQHVKMPKVNNNEDTGLLCEWLVENGTRVKAGDIIAVIETAKATIELEAEADGIITILVPAGEEYPVGLKMAEISLSAQKPRPSRPPVKEKTKNQSQSIKKQAQETPRDLIITRPARILMDEKKIALQDILALDKKIIRRSDILALTADQTIDSQKRIISLTRNQRTIARSVALSHQTIPAAFTLIKVNIQALEKIMHQIMADHQILISPVEIILFIISRIFPRHPLINSRLKNEKEIELNSHLNIGITLDAGKGLFTPVIKESEKMDLFEIISLFNEYRQKAIEGQFTQKDLADGNFTVSLNIEQDLAFTQPIIFPGQASILSLNGISEQLFYAHDKLVIRKNIGIGFHYDHRMINGSEAVLFLQALKQAVEKVSLEQLELPAPGKTDEQAANEEPCLPGPDETKPVRPIIISIWQELLKVNNPALDQTFFELGGTSRLMLEMITRLKHYFSFSFTVPQIMTYPTINKLTAFLEKKSGSVTINKPVYTKPQIQAGALPREEPVISQADSIAVIGMACRFPGAENTTQFWNNLENGIESIQTLTDNDLKEQVDTKLLNDKNYVKACSAIDQPNGFDAEFFGYNAREAVFMDPQQRKFLECSWQALEDAGYCSDHYPGKIGVFAGSLINYYLLDAIKKGLWHEELDFMQFIETFIGAEKDFIATRVAYKLDLTGPAVGVQTACSSSLTAVHLACQSLLLNESDICIAGAAAMRFPHTTGYHYLPGAMASPDGHCRAFDQAAQGTVFGSGIGAVVLKRLADAVRDHDTIHALIRGSAINNDGADKLSFTAPGPAGQEQVIKDACRKAAIDPAAISFIECHGTGTALGDPIEVSALGQAYSFDQPGRQPCYLGSVKTNIGHLDTAAGMAGLIKAIGVLKRKKIPPALHFQKLNSKIDNTNQVIRVNPGLVDWKPRQGNYAAVHSLGVGGTNAHLVLQAYQAASPLPSTRQWQMIPLSAKRRSDLANMEKNLQKYCRENTAVSLADIAYTYQTGRKAFACQKVILAQNSEDLHTQNFHSLPGETSKEKPDLVMEIIPFTPDGYQNAAHLYCDEPVFRHFFNLVVREICTLKNIDFNTQLAHMQTGQFSMPDLQKKLAIDFTSLSFIGNYSLVKTFIFCGFRPGAIFAAAVDELAGLAAYDMVTLKSCLQFLFLKETPLKLDQKEINSKLNQTRFYCHSINDFLTLPRINELSKQLKEMIFSNSKQHCASIKHSPAARVLHMSLINTSSPDQINKTMAAIEQTEQNETAQCGLLKTFSRLWLMGVPINWKNYHQFEARKKVSLPTYPFQSQHYCFSQLNPGSNSRPQQQMPPAVNQSCSDNYQLEWQEKLLPVNTEERTAHYLLTGNNSRIKLLKQKILKAAKTARVSLLSIDLPLEQQYGEQDLIVIKKRLEEIFQQAAEKIDRIIYCPGSEQSITDSSDWAQHQVSLFNDIQYLTCLIRFLVYHPAYQSQLLILTEDAQAVKADDQVRNVFQAALWGVSRVLQIEHNSCYAGIIDCPWQCMTQEHKKTIHLLLSNLKGEYAVRGEKIYQPLLVKKTALENIKPGQLTGKYIISGGLGALGSRAARWLIEQGAEQVIVIGRTLNEKVYRQLMDFSARILFLACDITDYQMLKSVFNAHQLNQTGIKGVIHTAGILDDNLIINQSIDKITSVLKPKILGAANLVHYFQAQKPDFFLFYSSIHSLTGCAGQIGYAAANSFLDAFAMHLSQTGINAKSISWGPWEQGMAKNKIFDWQERGMQPLTERQGLDMLYKMIHSPLVHRAAVNLDWQKYAAYIGYDKMPFLISGLVEIKDPGQIPAQKKEKQVRAYQDKNELVRQLQIMAGRLLGRTDYHEIDPGSGLHDMGIDSLLALKLCNQLNEEYHLQLLPTLIFNYPNIEQIADLIFDQINKIEQNDQRENNAPGPDPISFSRAGQYNLDELEAMDDKEAEKLYWMNYDEGEESL